MILLERSYIGKETAVLRGDFSGGGGGEGIHSEGLTQWVALFVKIRGGWQRGLEPSLHDCPS